MIFLIKKTSAKVRYNLVFKHGKKRRKPFNMNINRSTQLPQITS